MKASTLSALNEAVSSAASEILPNLKTSRDLIREAHQQIARSKQLVGRSAKLRKKLQHTLDSSRNQKRA